MADPVGLRVGAVIRIRCIRIYDGIETLARCQKRKIDGYGTCVLIGCSSHEPSVFSKTEIFCASCKYIFRSIPTQSETA